MGTTDCPTIEEVLTGGIQEGERQIRELTRERDAARREVEQLTVQVQMLEAAARNMHIVQQIRRLCETRAFATASMKRERELIDLTLAQELALLERYSQNGGGARCIETSIPTSGPTTGS